jgi:rRNA maturation endonuclease Nob1
MKDWIECQSCLTEFRVVADTDESIMFCPYCGGEIEHKDDEDEEDYEYEE